ncbi:hypothetical protein [[Eubacterium] cellulosolvens]
MGPEITYIRSIDFIFLTYFIYYTQILTILREYPLDIKRMMVTLTVSRVCCVFCADGTSTAEIRDLREYYTRI